METSSEVQRKDKATWIPVLAGAGAALYIAGTQRRPAAEILGGLAAGLLCSALVGAVLAGLFAALRQRASAWLPAFWRCSAVVMVALGGLYAFAPSIRDHAEQLLQAQVPQRQPAPPWPAAVAPEITDPFAATPGDATAGDRSQEDWNRRMGAWEARHAEFLSQPVRRQAMQQSLDELVKETHDELPNEELIRRAERRAFARTGWAVSP
ncbi:MAG: hypothetical protein HOQ02_01185 [Lysobacter sp.]|nr:hypothetical protein [Lysobacter sp.]